MFRTSEVELFPFTGQLVPVVRVRKGEVAEAHTLADKLELVSAAQEGDVYLAPWPGQWRTCVYIIDDVDATREALSIALAKAIARG